MERNWLGRSFLSIWLGIGLLDLAGRTNSVDVRRKEGRKEGSRVIETTLAVKFGWVREGWPQEALSVRVCISDACMLS